ncbi:YhgE/Pip family protein [Plantactinospora sp. KBS50]|uniref:YhgE/Pip family protein n=1 Tax=Plantactinospora sp. KBS50 TaxID=2024580 RepID=UPI000BAAD4C5|nr:YhgE/Pip domain-containing protein [Plantactinospora sp. KBS50]ASW54045.1 ABC transporter permease [Plantactinospora sp. KBS50]
MRVFHLARYELRRFTRGRLPAAALAVLTVVPLLYGALYLAAFWDPYGRLDRIPVALVNEDRPATATDGSPVHAGRDLADELVDRRVFDWRRTDGTRAEAGLRDGRFQLIFEIPADFSASLAAAPDPDQPARPGQLRVVSDDATNYLTGLLARTAFTEIQAAARTTASSGYFDRMLIGFTDAKQRTAEAADGAGRLRDGLDRSGSGAGQLADGLGDAADGADQLAGNLATATAGADQLADGLTTLAAGSAQLAAGAGQAASQTRAAATQINTAIDTWEPVLRRNATRIADAATLIADGAQSLAEHLDTLPGRADDLIERAGTVRDRLDALATAHPELADDPDLAAARAAAGRLVSDAQRLRSTLSDANLASFHDRLVTVAATARTVAAEAPHLADDVRAEQARLNQLVDGLGQLATAAEQVDQGSHRAERGAAELRTGLYRLATGAQDLDGGLGRLAGGGQRLADGLTDLRSGAAQLASGLADGARQLPGYDDAATRSGVLGDPVALDRGTRHAAASYGVGFAPYFLALALWVGAMITYMLLRPLNRRHVLSGAPARRVALAGWLPGLAVGLAQAVALYAVVTLGLGLHPVHPVGTLALLLLTAAAFTALVQSLGAWLGPAGRLAALALLMLQLTSSGGTYPVQTSPRFFQLVHPLVPMTYVVDALRHTVNGGPAGPVLLGAAVLVGFAGAAVVLSVAAARRARRLTPARLHPELAM